MFMLSCKEEQKKKGMPVFQSFLVYHRCQLSVCDKLLLTLIINFISFSEQVDLMLSSEII